MNKIIIPNNDNRVLEHDKQYVQFFDKKKQITVDLDTKTVLDKDNKPIYELYVEISNMEDPFSILCKKVDGNLLRIQRKDGVIKQYNYKDYYKNAFEKYKTLKTGKEEEILNHEDYEKTINELKAKLAELKSENNIENTPKRSKNNKQNNNSNELE